MQSTDSNMVLKWLSIKLQANWLRNSEAKLLLVVRDLLELVFCFVEKTRRKSSKSSKSTQMVTALNLWPRLLARRTNQARLIWRRISRVLSSLENMILLSKDLGQLRVAIERRRSQCLRETLR